MGGFTISNTIVAGNGFDVSGAVTSTGYNLIGNVGNSSGWLSTDILNQDPKLAQLADNGGQTQTQALLAGSPAINAGNNADAPATDQRGFARIVGGTIDIGAYESDTPQAPTCSFLISPSFQEFTSAGGTGTITVSASQAGCPYSSLNESSFVTLNSGATGTGNGTVTFTVAPNSGVARSITIFVAGQSFTVNQAGGKSRKRVRFF